jgi:hypothetical protein
MTGDAAGVAAAYCAKHDAPTPKVSVEFVQQRLRAAGVVLGVPAEAAGAR